MMSLKYLYTCLYLLLVLKVSAPNTNSQLSTQCQFSSQILALWRQSFQLYVPIIFDTSSSVLHA